MRKHYIDNIRCFTVLLVVLYHIIYMFNSVITEGVIGPISAFHGQDVIQYLLYPWFMVILFLISGMSAKYYLDTHSVKEFVRARTRKLLVPSTIGLLVTGWMQGYYNMLISEAFDNIPAETPQPVMYLIMAVSGTGVLWTIQVMWIFSMLLLVFRKLVRIVCKGDKEFGVSFIWLLIAFLPLCYVSAQILNTPIIPVYRFGIYGFAFFTGYFIFSAENTTDELKRFSVPLLAAAVILGITYTIVYFGKNYAVTPVVNCPLAIAYSWVMCLALIGSAKRWFDSNYAFIEFMKKRSFGLYVFHYLPLSACAYYLHTYTKLPGIVLYILTAIAAYAGGLILNEVISRIPVVRWCSLGIRKEKKNVL